ncbi:MAG: putative Ig domain-containing protein [Thiobacillus sp.]|uniref:putative Ig domain-containing protein n=1 Tax=Thiobacillus sp. TaxID=924 RepID=UPI00168C73D2|nr:putative Ig domain-containing protein [Thiobacillus sp.]QLQ03576.1 MAG: putative Ig domain-containing protein [Thiobacillus sp.]
MPTWLHFDTATRTFSGTPDAAGVLSVAVTAKDTGNLTVSDVFEIAVGGVVITNHAPELSHALPDQAATEGAPFSYTVAADTFSDPDAGDSLTYTATLADGSALPAWLGFDAETRTFNGTPDAAGTYSVVVTAKDMGDLAVSDVFDITVDGVVVVNHAPELSHALPDQAATEGAAFSYTVAADAFSDPDAGDSLTYTATLADGSALPAWLGFDAATRTFSGTPSGSGTVSVRVTAKDMGELAASDVFELVVASAEIYTTLNGTSVSEILNGTSGNDAINGVAGDDVIYGNAGNDIINGGSGNDTLFGGEGNDLFQVEGDSGSDTVNGGDGFDEIRGSDGDDVIRFTLYNGTNTVERIDGGLGYNRIASGAWFGNMDFSATELVNIARIEGERVTT